jgi:hypothetical protein
MLRILKFGIIATVLQLTLYWATFYFSQKISISIWNNEYPSDAAYFYSVGVLGFLLCIVNIFSAIINTQKANRFSAFLLSALIILAWSEDFISWPYQTTFCIAISIITICSKFYFDKILTKYLSE